MTVARLTKQLNDPMSLIEVSRKGIPFKLFESIVAHGVFDIKEWAAFLHLTERTLQRYKKEQLSFGSLHSEKIIEIARLEKRGLDLFEGKENFDIWMNSKLVALGGMKPIDFLDTSFGITIIEDELTRIEYGVLA